MLEEAIQLFEEVIILTDKRPLIDEAYHLMSDCYLFLGKGEQALETINTIRTSKRVNPEAIVANIHYMMGKVNEGNIKSQDNLYKSLTDIIANLCNYVWNNREKPELCLKYLELEENIINAFNKNQDSYLSLELSYCYENKAWNYCKLNHTEMALFYLKKAILLTTILNSNPDLLNNKPYFYLIEVESLYNQSNDLNKALKKLIFSGERSIYESLYDENEFKELIQMLE